MKPTYLILLTCLFISCSRQETIQVVTSVHPLPQILFATKKLTQSLKDLGYGIRFLSDTSTTLDKRVKTIYIGIKDSAYFKGKSGKEGFQIRSQKNNIQIAGYDASGALYGTLALLDSIQEKKGIPSALNFSDQPEMVMRGTCIGLQKTSLLPGRGVYEYPYTPKNFPWFYNKKLWIGYLDMLVENRFNSLYLWNGHPFASLVKLKDYPFAVEVGDETFKKNEEIYKFITNEANKRGIWVIQMFYNIIVSKPFAEHYGIKTQDRQRPIKPLIADYTRKSITAFIEKYPNVGLMVALGEAMSGKQNDVDWFTKTIIPGVKDGLKAIGKTGEPPIILRAHDTDAPLVMENALPIYKNLYTTNKYNGESLTTYQPGGNWAISHRKLSSLGSVHIDNVHILANLEPFRYGSPDFIQKSVKAMHKIHGANGLHLYPQASYWDWPYTADKTEPRLLEMDRDWIWYKAWARYAWKSNRKRANEVVYWSKQLSDKFGVEIAEGRNILEAYEQIGEIAPRTLRKFGITEGNRQTLLLGMFESQLVNPYKYHVYPDFYESTGPKGEILVDYAKKEWNHKPHIGETPPKIIDSITKNGRLAVEAIDKVTGKVTKNQEEFKRLKNDIHCYKTFADFFAEKVKTALLVLRYQYSGERTDLEKALPHLEKSIDNYKKLVALTKGTYLYANSMQTSMRRIPIGGNDGKFKSWEEMLPLYEAELDNFKRNLARLKSPSSVMAEKATPWKPATVKFLDATYQTYSIRSGEKIYKKDTLLIEKKAEELHNLQGIYYPEKEQIEQGTLLKFENAAPVKLVVGYFNTTQKRFLLPPTLETNAAGNMRGQADVVLANAIKFKNYPRVNIHTYRFEAGKNELYLGKGRVLLLGFMAADQEIKIRDAGLIGENEKKAIDWLFY